MVNEQLQASVPDVYAIGDVATFPQRRYNCLSRVEHVTSCRKTAVSAVASIMGTLPNGHDYLPHFYSRVFNLAWKFNGMSAVWKHTTINLFLYGICDYVIIVNSGV